MPSNILRIFGQLSLLSFLMLAGWGSYFLLSEDSQLHSLFTQIANASDEPTGSFESAAHLQTYDIEICNHSAQEVVYAAVAYFDASIDSWVQKGWYAVQKEKCSIPLKNLKPPLFAFAETDKRQMEWGGDGGGQKFCVHASDKFTFRLQNCVALIAETSLVRWQAFTPLVVSGEGGIFRWDLLE